MRAGDLVEGDRVVLDHEPGLVLAILPAEEVGDGTLAAREENHVRRDLAVDERLAGLAGAEFDQVVVPLDHRDEPEEQEELDPPGQVGMTGLVAHGPEQDVGPLLARELLPPLDPFVHTSGSDLDRLHPLDHERPGDAAVQDRVVIDQLDVRPDAAGQNALVLLDHPLVDMDLVEAGRGKLGPVLTALVLLVEGDGDEVDQFHHAMLPQARLDKLVLVGPDDPLGDRALDEVKPLFYLVVLGRRAVLAKEVLEHVDRDREAHLQFMDEVLADDPAREGRDQPLVQRVREFTSHRYPV